MHHHGTIAVRPSEITPDDHNVSETHRVGEVRNATVAHYFSQYVDQWTVHMHARSMRPVTISERVRVVRKLEEDTGTAAHQVTADQVTVWLASGPWSASSRNTYYGYLRSWFEWLQRQDVRTDNPMVKIGTPRRPRTQPRPVHDKHLHQLLSVPMRRKTRAMILLAALQGLRVHEIAKFRGQDLDLIAGTLHVEGKGGAVYDLPLHPMIAELAETMPRTGWWFPTNSRAANPNGHVRSTSVSDVMGGAMRRAGVPGTPHALRHWFGTTLVDSGVDLRTTQELMRHASLATTQIYTRVSDRRRTAGIRALDPFRATSTEPLPPMAEAG